ncbi:MAG TPA: hypothetical protein VGW38_24770, partial [Chloroflexota bacterium]|nr:hypothetical protein [Chloroflexota bacterium]
MRSREIVDPIPLPVAQKSRKAFSLSPAFLLISDVLAITGGFVLAFFVRFVLEFPAAQEIQNARAYAGFLATATPICLVSFAAYGLYQPRNLVSMADQLFRLVTAVLVGLVITVAVSSFVVRGWPDYSRLLLAYLWIACTGLACAGRFVWVLWRDRLARLGDAVRTVLIVGAGIPGQRVAEHFTGAPQLGYRVLGFLDDVPADHPSAGYPVVGTIADLNTALERFQPDELILADVTLANHELLEIINRCEGQPIGIRIYPDVFQMLVTEASVVNLRGLQLLGVHATELQAWQRTVKR